MARESRVKSTLGGKEKEHKPKTTEKKTPKGKEKGKGKHPVHRMHISKTDNGKFLVDHEFKGGPGEATLPNESHAIEPGDLASHVADHFGVGAEGPGAPMAPAPAAPAPGPEVMPAGPLPTGPTGV
jgi:hypothetical protein